ncbi:ABC transporter ATP-binding protein [Sedimentibacter sp.]|uniref:ABC transporter ATP-binding protein n=1 Tax=Sedimentibacter sp. TaxID=1960295 RepID=UPI0028A071CD|nr:ABC transporter ATP-binding protein [Sedimentibacter sp.]
MDKAIIIENLSKMYKNNRGIHDINLEIDRGEIFGFLGPNGAGKTTTMKIMVGLMKADKGDVILNGYRISKDYEKAMKKVGCIVESVNPFSYLTAYENMKLCGRFNNDVDGARIDECLEITGLIKYKNEKIKHYSLGMKQRIGIAMAILSNPEVLILDEPLNGLDVEGMVEMRKLILNLSEQHKTTFFISSHLIHDIELTCNKVGILYNGKLLGVDKTHNILKNYSSLENYYLSEVI